MKTYELLQTKGDQVFSISPDATLSGVVRKLMDHNCGALIVLDGQRLMGIITERDILRCCADDQRALDQIKVSEKMTRNLVTAKLQDPVDHVMRLMTNNRVRHLPILEDEKLVGVISIGDTVKAQHSQLSLENEFLKTYIHG